MPLRHVRINVDGLGCELPDPALGPEISCTLARVAEAKRTQQPMRCPTLSAKKQDREENESVIALSKFTVEIAGSKVPVLDPSKALLLKKMDQACPGTFLHHNHPTLLLSRFRFSEVEVDETAFESDRSGSTGSARSSTSGGSLSCSSNSGSDSELDEDGSEPAAALLQLQPERAPEPEPEPEVPLSSQPSQPSQPQPPQPQLPQLPHEEEELPHEQVQELPLAKPCQSAPTMAAGTTIVSGTMISHHDRCALLCELPGMVFVLLLSENGRQVDHGSGLVAQVGALLWALAGRRGCSGRSPAGSLGRGCFCPARCLILLVLSPRLPSRSRPPALAACARQPALGSAACRLLTPRGTRSHRARRAVLARVRPELLRALVFDLAACGGRLLLWRVRGDARVAGCRDGCRRADHTVV